MFQLGLPRENLSTGLNLILAQSLIKKLCERCKIVDPHPAEDYGGHPVYKSVGCPECFNKGTRGRTAMAELLYFNDEVKEWVENRQLTARDVVNRAIEKGYLLTMRQVAREKVLAGITSETEVAAVLGLVESKRQHSNAAFAARAAAAGNADPMARDAEAEAIDGEIVG
jgi:type II secretory ATPase GspE/PulE/Tfp pilus assembly ATPase PilB-like protein